MKALLLPVVLASLASCTLRDLDEYMDGEPATSSSSGAGGSGAGGITGGAPTGGFGAMGGSSTGGMGAGGGAPGCPVVPCQENATCVEDVDGTFDCVCADGLVEVLDGDADYCAIPYQAVAVGLDHACALTLEGHPHCWGRNWGAALGMLDDTTTNEDDFSLAPRSVGAYVFESIGAGRQYTCGLTPESPLQSNVACWGRNSSGQLGRGDTTIGALPQPITASVEGPIQFASLHVAYQTVCGISVDDDLYCWGDNSQKQISTSASTGISVPTRVEFGTTTTKTLFTKVRAVAMSHLHTCVIERDTGDVYCWGYNNASQVKASGTNAFAPNAAERRVAPLQTTWTAVAAGADFSCGLATSTASADPGQYVCWGNSKSIASVSAPGAVMNAGTVGSPRSHWSNLCHLGEDDSLQCKGTSGLGQLGTNASLAQYDDVYSTDASGTVFTETFSDVAIGPRASCGLGTDMAVRCWGARASGVLGQSGSSPHLPEELPPPVAGGVWTAVDVSPQHACGLAGLELGTGGELFCWGLNGDGELGTADRLSRTQPTKVALPGEPGAQWAEVAVGAAHTCAIRAGGTSVHCWGMNNSMQVGPTIGVYDAPLQVSIPEVGGTFSHIALGDLFSCVTHQSGPEQKVYCWGRLPGTSVGASPHVITPPVGFEGPITELVGAGGHVCALHGIGHLSCWGENGNGEVGDGSILSSTTPVLVPLSDVEKVAVGANHTCAVASGAGYCWGGNGNLQVSPTGMPHTTPNLLAPSAYAAVFPINTASTFGLTSAGALYGWGNSLNQELFIGNLTANSASHVPLTVAPLAGQVFAHVSGGDDGICALTSDGKLFCWGIEFGGLRGSDATAQLAPRVIDPLQL